MVLMEVAQRRAMTVPDLELASARTRVMTAIAVLEKETYDRQGR